MFSENKKEITIGSMFVISFVDLAPIQRKTTRIGSTNHSTVVENCNYKKSNFHKQLF
jgi:hypothetical protein